MKSISWGCSYICPGSGTTSLLSQDTKVIENIHSFLPVWLHKKEEEQRQTSLAISLLHWRERKMRWISAPGFHLGTSGHRVEKLTANWTALQEGLRVPFPSSAFIIIKVVAKLQHSDLRDKHCSSPAQPKDRSTEQRCVHLKAYGLQSSLIVRLTWLLTK